MLDGIANLAAHFPVNGVVPDLGELYLRPDVPTTSTNFDDALQARKHIRPVARLPSPQSTGRQSFTWM